MNTLTIVRFTLREAASRRLILAGLALSAGFLGLFALGYAFMYANVSAQTAAHGANSSQVLAGLSAVLTIMGLYAVSFMSSFLALFLSVGAISGEIDAGTLHAVLARPIRRAELVVGRWLAYLGLTLGYVGAMVSLLLLVARAISGFEAPQPVPAALLMMLQATVLLTLSLLGSSLMPTLANGITVFSLFGLAWMAGIVEFVGRILRNDAMLNLATAVSLLVPSDALWRGASYYLQPPVLLAASGSATGGIPFLGGAPPTTAMIAWGILYPAVMLGGATLAFSRRDL